MLGRIERLLEGAVEGTTRGLFRVQLQPVELAKAAARAMDRQMIIGPDGPEVANVYRIRIHPEDFARFAAYRVSLVTKIERYVDIYARDRGLRPVAAWQIELLPDETVPRRRVRVDAEMTDLVAPAPSDAHIELLDGTIPLSSLGDAADTPLATITLEDGRQLVLEHDVTSLGRALDNDVVIADGRVSRYHVQIVNDGRGLVAHDLGSTNGTSVAGRKAVEHRLVDGDRLSLGGYTIGVRITGHND